LYRLRRSEEIPWEREVRLARRRERERVRCASLSTESSNTKIPDSNTALAVCHKCNAKMKLAKCANQCVANVILEDMERKVHRVTIFNEVLYLIFKGNTQKKPQKKATLQMNCYTQFLTKMLSLLFHN